MEFLYCFQGAAQYEVQVGADGAPVSPKWVGGAALRDLPKTVTIQRTMGEILSLDY